MQNIVFPSACPSCGVVLELRNDILYCTNSSCGERSLKQIENFAKTLKIKGLGASTIKKLELHTICDIYSLSENEIIEALSSEKLGKKLFVEIENSKSLSLNDILPGFSIPLIGRTATEKLSKTHKTIFDITDFSCREAGLGEKATANLISWMEECLDYFCTTLPFDWTFKNSVMQKLKGIVCITGKLSSYKTKAEAAKELKSRGFLVKSTLTKDVTILVNESGQESIKTKQAKDRGLTVIDNLLNFLEN